MDKLQMQIIAGVPITPASKKPVIESMTDRSLTRSLKNLIGKLDSAVSASTNREDKSMYNDGASDLEDILAIVKTGKQKKARKLYSELDSKIKSYITSKLDPKKAESFKKYFTPITEMVDLESEEGQQETADMDDTSMEYDDNSGEQPEDSGDVESDAVQCPFCECGTTVPKMDFYDHIMGNHVEEAPEEQGLEQQDSEEQTQNPDDEFDINLGTLDGGSTLGMATQMSMGESAVDATVWDKTDDKNESPSAYPVDDDKISLPKNIKSSLEKEIKALQKSSDELVNTDYSTAEFQNNVANAMIEVLNHLTTETEHGMKMAQVCITKYMSPIVQKFPSEVYDFILHGGYDTKTGTENSLVSMFKEIKNGK